MSLRSLRLTMPFFTVPMAAALRVRAPIHTLVLGPLAAERMAVPAVGSFRNLRATPAMCADRTVVQSCTDRIQEALSPQVRRARSGRWSTPLFDVWCLHRHQHNSVGCDPVR